MSATYIRSVTLDKLIPDSKENLLPLTSMSMGDEVAQFLIRPVSVEMKDELKSFLEKVQLFYIEAALQIKNRFPINDEILKSLVFLNPETINSTPLE